MSFLHKVWKEEEEKEIWAPVQIETSSFEEFAKNSGFIAQERILRELDLFIADLFQGNFSNFLLQAYSGYGKTTLAKLIAEYVDPSGNHVEWYLPKEGIIVFNPDAVVHIVDEAHLLKDPEGLYEYMSSGDHLFIVATNEFDKLKEPFLNRCVPFVFEPYEDDHIAQIIKPIFERYDLGTLDNSWLLEFARYGRNNPRVSKMNAKRIALMLRKDFDGEKTINKDNVFDVIKEYLSIERGGFNQYDRSYIEALEACGGKASLNLLTSLVQLPQNIITKEVEPFLVRKGIIQITKGGRVLLKKGK